MGATPIVKRLGSLFLWTYPFHPKQRALKRVSFYCIKNNWFFKYKVLKSAVQLSVIYCTFLLYVKSFLCIVGLFSEWFHFLTGSKHSTSVVLITKKNVEMKGFSRSPVILRNEDFISFLSLTRKLSACLLFLGFDCLWGNGMVIKRRKIIGYAT